MPLPEARVLGSLSDAKRDQGFFLFPFKLYRAMLLPQTAFPGWSPSGNPIIIVGVGLVVNALNGIFSQHLLLVGLL